MESIQIIDKNFLRRPKRAYLLSHKKNTELQIRWEKTVLKTLQSQVEHLEKVKSEIVPRRDILLLAILARRASRELSYFQRRQNKFLIDRAKSQVHHYRMKAIVEGGPREFEKQLNSLNRNIEAIHCQRCGRALTNPVSKGLGIGPVCRRKNCS